MPDRPQKYQAQKPQKRENSTPINSFLQSLADILPEITALEVSTIVVEEITPNKFLPRQVYRELYPISQSFLENTGIHESLIDRYLQLHRTLLLKYISLVATPQSSLYSSELIEAVNESYHFLGNSSNDPKESPIQLPDPTDSRETEQLEQLLSNPNFLRCLRKLGEFKAILDQGNYRLQKKLDPNLAEMLTEVIYARTVVQLDGDVLNSYNKKLFQHPQQQAILQIHQDGVNASQHYWQGLLEFIIHLTQRALPKPIGKGK